MKNLLIKIASIATELDNNGLEKEAKQMHRIFLKIAESPLRIHRFQVELKDAQEGLIQAENAYFREMEKMQNQEYYDEFLSSPQPFEFSRKIVWAGTLLARKDQAEERLNNALEGLKNEGVEQIFKPKHAKRPKVSPEKAELFEYLARNFLEENKRDEDYKSKIKMESDQELENKNLALRQRQQEEQRKIDEKEKQIQEQRDFHANFYANSDEPVM